MSREATSIKNNSRPLFPGWIARLIIAVTLIFAFLVRVLHRTAYPPWPVDDPAVCRLLQVVFVFAAAVTFWIWFCFRSAYGRSLRRAGIIAPFVALAVLAGAFRF